MLRTVIVDDDLGMRLIARLLVEEEGCAVVGEAETGEQAVRLAARVAPDVVLMDYRLPGMDGIEAMRLIRRARPGVTVIAWTASDDPNIAGDFLAAGARAHATKADFEALREALRGARSQLTA